MPESGPILGGQRQYRLNLRHPSGRQETLSAAQHTGKQQPAVVKDSRASKNLQENKRTGEIISRFSSHSAVDF
jgi:hypothetical protein